MGDGSGDLQRVWHEFVGAKLLAELSPTEPLTVFDVGAGRGLSKPRLAQGRHKVTTQDINRACMNDVDVIAELADFLRMPGPGLQDVVTSFDVIEHTVSPSVFIDNLLYLARKLAFFTTPNHALYPQPWHYTADGIRSLVEPALKALPVTARWFCRYKAGEIDKIEELPLERFLHDDPHAYAFGVGLYL